MTKEKTRTIKSTNGICDGVIYEQVLLGNKPVFLTYSVNELNKALFEEKNLSWKIFFDFQESLSRINQEGITEVIVPERKTLWPPVQFNTSLEDITKKEMVDERSNITKMVDRTVHNIPDEKFLVEKTSTSSEKALPEYLMSDEELNEEIRKFIHTYVYLMYDPQYDVLTSWDKSTWLPECCTSVPYLNFSGAFASGKSKCQEALVLLSYHPIKTSNISAPALYRALEKYRPTVFVDEFEHMHKDVKREISGILNAGYRRGEYVIRCVGEGKDQDIGLFDVFGFKYVRRNVRL